MKVNKKEIVDDVITYVHWALVFFYSFWCLVAYFFKLYYSLLLFFLGMVLLLPFLKKYLIQLPFLKVATTRYALTILLLMGGFVFFKDLDIADDKPKATEETSLRGGLMANDKNETIDIKSGKYYALVIGINDYESKHLPKLLKPVKDARAFYQLINKNFHFDSIKLITDAKKSDIMRTLMRYRKTLKSDDNLLVFYAGHGYEDKANKQGYWLPKDADPDDPTNWISNTDIIDQLKPIPAKHKLLISDACFSGGIFAARAANFESASKTIQELYNASSCTAMTSGAHTEVPDESVFLRYLLSSMQKDTSKFISAGHLFYSFSDKVIHNSKQRNLIPQYGSILNIESEGGDFIFIRR